MNEIWSLITGWGCMFCHEKCYISADVVITSLSVRQLFLQFCWGIKHLLCINNWPPLRLGGSDRQSREDLLRGPREQNHHVAASHRASCPAGPDPLQLHSADGATEPQVSFVKRNVKWASRALIINRPKQNVLSAFSVMDSLLMEHCLWPSLCFSASGGFWTNVTFSEQRLSAGKFEQLLY